MSFHCLPFSADASHYQEVYNILWLPCLTSHDETRLVEELLKLINELCTLTL